jgi:hypothetical protein
MPKLMMRPLLNASAQLSMPVTIFTANCHATAMIQKKDFRSSWASGVFEPTVEILYLFLFQKPKRSTNEAESGIGDMIYLVFIF